MRVSSDRVPGFAFEIALENVQLTGHWPPQLTIGVSTDGSGIKPFRRICTWKHIESLQPAIVTRQHDYGIDWEPTSSRSIPIT